jgi:hypothetical protein
MNNLKLTQQRSLNTSDVDPLHFHDNVARRTIRHRCNLRFNLSHPIPPKGSIGQYVSLIPRPKTTEMLHLDSIQRRSRYCALRKTLHFRPVRNPFSPPHQFFKNQISMVGVYRGDVSFGPVVSNVNKLSTASNLGEQGLFAIHFVIICFDKNLGVCAQFQG